jgi:LemA protein
MGARPGRAKIRRNRRYDRGVVGLWIAIGVIGVLVLLVALAFNRLVALRNRVDNGWSQIDVQLRRRYDLIPNLVQAVKGYAAHERDLFEHVAEARSAALGARDVPAQAQAENVITAGLRRLFAVAENYPELKANQNFLALQEELTGTESKIAYARQFYNDQVMRLNTLTQAFPTNLIAGAFHVEPRSFFEIDEPARGPIQVDL